MSSLYGTPESEPVMPSTRMESTPTTTVRQTDVRARTLTTLSRYPKAELILSRISKYEHQRATVRSQGTQTTQSKLTDPRNLLSEADYSELLREFFSAQGWEYKEQYPTKSGKAIDFVVKAPHDGGHIFFGVECKRDLHSETNVTSFADYLEQAAAYSVDLKMPVFLAPIMHYYSPSGLYSGGQNVRALNALCIFGGRFNIGLMANRLNYWDNVVTWFMVIRGAKFWDEQEGFNDKRLNMVCSTGSKKERKPLKVWK